MLVDAFARATGNSGGSIGAYPEFVIDQSDVSSSCKKVFK